MLSPFPPLSASFIILPFGFRGLFAVSEILGVNVAQLVAQNLPNI
jgi:hypothetical protein